MKVKEKKWIRFRIYLVATMFFCCLCTILARGYQLQVLEKDKLLKIAEAGYRGKIKLPPKRGTIYDREGHEIAVSVEVGSVYAHPSHIKNKNTTARHLSKILNIELQKTKRLISSKRSFVWIKRKVSPEKIREIKALKLEGLSFVKESRRYYPGKEIAGHLIGFAGSDNQGLEGVEKKYDKYLKGPENILAQMRDALGRPFYISRTNPGDEMHDLVLTIDKDIQYKAEQFLKATVEKTNAKSGQCIVMDPETGEILAMAVAPLFNPNVFQKYRPQNWRNRAVTDCYEPGSTIKAFLLAAVLEDDLLSPHTKFYCEKGSYKVARHIIHDTGEYGEMTVADIIVHSSNIGAVKIGARIGYERFEDYLRRFGFGKKTDVGLGGERKGFIRPAKKAKQIDKANLYFGQGMTASSMQLASAMSVIANGGKLMKPYLVSEIKDQGGRVVKRNRPTMVRRILRERTARRVAQILEGVVSEDGTAPLAAIKGYRVAGKTGTSQKVDPRTGRYSKRSYVAVFTGLVPVNNPRLVMVVTVDEPRPHYYGGLIAGPVFRDVGSWTLNHLRVNPEVVYAKADASQEEEAQENMNQEQSSDDLIETADLVNPTGKLPDFRGRNMREVLREGRSLGLEIVLDGTGVATRQVPMPGTNLDNVKEVKVSFMPPA